MNYLDYIKQLLASQAPPAPTSPPVDRPLNYQQQQMANAAFDNHAPAHVDKIYGSTMPMNGVTPEMTHSYTSDDMAKSDALRRAAMDKYIQQAEAKNQQRDFPQIKKSLNSDEEDEDENINNKAGSAEGSYSGS